jgi:hypothetical protein
VNPFFNDPNQSHLPPEEVRLSDVRLAVYPKADRVRVRVELTPFTERPNLRVRISDTAGKVIAQSDILETMLPSLEFTLHLRAAEREKEYTLEAEVYYQKVPMPSDAPIDIHLPDPLVVDRRKVTFCLPALET